MSMFDTTGQAAPAMPGPQGKPLRKLERMNARCATRSPTGCRSAIFSGAASSSAGGGNSACPPTANPYYYYDLDWIVTVPNMDPVDSSL